MPPTTITEVVRVGAVPGAPNIGRPPQPGTPQTLRTRLDQEYVAAGSNLWLTNYIRALSIAIDDITADFGADLYERMLLDSQIASTVNWLKAAILEDGLTLRPAVEDKDQPGYEQATQYVETYERILDDLDPSLDAVLWDLLSAVAFGNRVAELVYDDSPLTGAPRLRLSRIHVKPLRSTAFVVDVYNNLIGLLGLVPGQSGSVLTQSWMTVPQDAPNLIPREKFALLSYRQVNNDPRGTSILRAAFTDWNELQQTRIERMRWAAQFAGPSVVGTTPDGAQAMPLTDDLGNAIDSTLRSPEQQMATELAKLRNGTALAFPSGSTVTPIAVGNDGSAFNALLDDQRRQITKAILSQTLATEEGKFGTRAQASVHQDTGDTIVRQAKRAVARMVERDLLRRSVAYNDGAAAAQYAPKAHLGAEEQQDFAADAAAVAQLEKAGYLDDSQKPGVDERLNLPARAPGWENRAAVKAASARKAFAGATLPGQTNPTANPTQEAA